MCVKEGQGNLGVGKGDKEKDLEGKWKEQVQQYRQWERGFRLLWKMASNGLFERTVAFPPYFGFLDDEGPEEDYCPPAKGIGELESEWEGMKKGMIILHSTILCVYFSAFSSRNFIKSEGDQERERGL